MAPENRPFVSVVVTTFNRKELLKETISSILNQTYQNFELIVVDNYSSYDFSEHIRSFNDSRIKAFQNQNGGNIAVNRNFGIGQSKGEFIAFCDDDDLWLPEKLELQIASLNDDIIGVGSDIDLVDNNSEVVERRGEGNDLALDFHRLIQFNNVPLSSLLVRSTGLLFEESDAFFAVEDFDFQLRLTKDSGKAILRLGQSLVLYRVNTLNRNSGIQQKKNSLAVIKRYEKQLSTQLRKNLYQLIHYRIGKISLGNNKLGEAKKHFIISLGHVYWKNSRLMKILSGLLICYLPSYFRNRIVRRT